MSEERNVIRAGNYIRVGNYTRDEAIAIIMDWGGYTSDRAGELYDGFASTHDIGHIPPNREAFLREFAYYMGEKHQMEAVPLVMETLGMSEGSARGVLRAAYESIKREREPETYRPPTIDELVERAEEAVKLGPGGMRATSSFPG